MMVIVMESTHGSHKYTEVLHFIKIAACTFWSLSGTQKEYKLSSRSLINCLQITFIDCISIQYPIRYYILVLS